MINVPSMASRAGMLIGVLLVAIAITIGIGSTAFAQAARSPTAGQTLYLPLVIGGQDRPDPLHIAERDALFAWMQKERAAAHPACAANQIQQHASLMAAAQEWAMLIDSIEPTFLGRRPREEPTKLFDNGIQTNYPAPPPAFFARYGIRPMVWLAIDRSIATDIWETHKNEPMLAGDPFSFAIGCPRSPFEEVLDDVAVRHVPIRSGVGMGEHVIVIFHAYEHDFPKGMDANYPVNPPPYTAPLPLPLHEIANRDWEGNKEAFMIVANTQRWFHGCPTEMTESPRINALVEEWYQNPFPGQVHSTHEFSERYNIDSMGEAIAPVSPFNLENGGAFVENGGHFFILIACNIGPDELQWDPVVVGMAPTVFVWSHVFMIERRPPRYPSPAEWGTYRPCRPDPNRPGQYLYDNNYYESQGRPNEHMLVPGRHPIVCARVLEDLYAKHPHLRPAP